MSPPVSLPITSAFDAPDGSDGQRNCGIWTVAIAALTWLLLIEPSLADWSQLLAIDSLKSISS
ncbi:MAG: hypothetical protein DWQ31_12005 [Planctomycetota bacterium]|nr:MAG: hypothetical protein DWQ31_12005 [Planctomycetota bacterium]REJ87340.1 MAG: hypothetical protein DWQ35_21555 [Planctomycetota bacterium]